MDIRDTSLKPNGRAGSAGAWVTWLLLMAVLVLKYHGLWVAYWRADDPALLHYAMQTSWAAPFLDPASWHQISGSNLTPWLIFSLKLDLALFGLNPSAFYAHQLLAMAALLSVAVRLLQRWVPLPWVAMGLGLFVIAPPTASVVEALMTRHYLEGLLAALLALWAFVRADEARSLGARSAVIWSWQVVSWVAYVVALTAKEVYAPLPLLLLVWPMRTDRRGLRVLPFWVILGLYLGWRRLMLGVVSGGYAASETWLVESALVAFGHTLQRLPALMWGEWWGVPLGLTFLASLWVLGCRLRRAVPAMVLGLIAVAPLLPLSIYPGVTAPDRYLFLPVFLLNVGVLSLVGQACAALPERARWALGVLFGLAWGVPTAVHEARQAQARGALAQEYDVQGRYLWAHEDGETYIPSEVLLNTYLYADQLCRIKAQAGVTCPTALMLGHDLPAPGAAAVRAYEAGHMRVLDPAQVRQRLALEGKVALQAQWSLQAGVLRWRLEADVPGAFAVVSREFGRYWLPAEGSLRTGLKGLEFRLLHVDVAGRVGSSPLLRLTHGEFWCLRVPAAPSNGDCPLVPK
ncbi:hypothetical protein [Inhella gelatinilytica]|uniref:Uncharacterized protein n=1 Tax=Inhella gelatinilytica TaxID=2795030 RepID=A0A931NA41_9BURK|nr:hypothetical protein [Inhella gelatinilytica]MBH9552063.1 hypothetical protein [Inhella gelatinilytica]